MWIIPSLFGPPWVRTLGHPSPLKGGAHGVGSTLEQVVVQSLWAYYLDFHHSCTQQHIQTISPINSNRRIQRDKLRNTDRKWSNCSHIYAHTHTHIIYEMSGRQHRARQTPSIALFANHRAMNVSVTNIIRKKKYTLYNIKR